jgi:hypothetical protein
LIEAAEERKRTTGNRKHPELHNAVAEIATSGLMLNAKKLGLWLKRYRGRIVNGLRLASDTDRHTKQQRWCVTESSRG